MENCIALLSFLKDPFDINIPLDFSDIDSECTEAERLASVTRTGM